MKNKLGIVLLVLVGLVLGFGMEWVKIEINWLIQNAQRIPGFFELTYPERIEVIKQLPPSGFYDYYSNHDHIDVLNHLSQPALVKLKWIVTIVFCLLFFLLCNAILLVAKIPFKKELLWMYGVSFSSALIIYVIGKLAGIDFYPFSRLVIGFLQSLIPVVIIVLISFIKNKNG